MTLGRAPAAALAVLLAAACPLAARSGAGAGPDTELLELLDKVLADPSDEVARSKLDAVAGRAAAAEKAAAEKERRALLKEASAAHRRSRELAAAKKKRLAAWKKIFSKACSLASDADRAAEAVALYEELLESFPVYSDNKELLPDSSEKIMAIFFKTVKKSYPYLAQGRDRADERMLASLHFSRVSERHSLHGGLPPSGITESQLKKAERLRWLEASLKALQGNMTEGLSLFSRKRWSEAADNFEKILDFDWENEEALHYHSLAMAKMQTAPGTR